MDLNIVQRLKSATKSKIDNTNETIYLKLDNSFAM